MRQQGHQATARETADAGQGERGSCLRDAVIANRSSHAAHGGSPLFMAPLVTLNFVNHGENSPGMWLAASRCQVRRDALSNAAAKLGMPSITRPCQAQAAPPTSGGGGSRR